MCNDWFDQNTDNLAEEDISNSDIEKVQEELSRIAPQGLSRSLDIYDIFPKLEWLTKKETEVINYRFGLEGEQRHTTDETCERFRITRERIRQIETKAGGRCRRNRRALRDYLESLFETESEDEQGEDYNDRS